MTMITPSYLGETIEYSSLHACRSTLEDPTWNVVLVAGAWAVAGCTENVDPSRGPPPLPSTSYVVRVEATSVAGLGACPDLGAVGLVTGSTDGGVSYSVYYCASKGNGLQWTQLACGASNASAVAYVPSNPDTLLVCADQQWTAVPLPAGEAGPQGAQGDAGPTGSQGPAGDAGASGALVAIGTVPVGGPECTAGGIVVYSASDDGGPTYECNALAGANLQGADLGGINLAGADLSGANLAGANLAYANLSGSTLKNANLGGANLRWAFLDSTNLEEANLTEANFTEANLESADLQNANARNANFTNAYLVDANLGLPAPPPECFDIPTEGQVCFPTFSTFADILGSNFAGANLNGAKTEDFSGFTGAISQFPTCSTATICPNGTGYGAAGANCPCPQ